MSPVAVGSHNLPDRLTSEHSVMNTYSPNLIVILAGERGRKEGGGRVMQHFLFIKSSIVSYTL